MSYRMGTISAAVAAAALMASPLILAQTAKDASKPKVTGHAFGTPVAYRNLTIVPVIDRLEKPGTSYKTLAEALRDGTVTVRESGSGGGEVNTLILTNTGNRPVYILAGEVVLGGQQDRCVGRDILLPAGARDFAVPVYCVEHGRWTGTKEFGSVAKAVVSLKVRREAQEGVLAQAPATAGQTGPSLRGGSTVRATAARQSAVGSAQSKVWARVAEENKAFGAESQTGTYRRVLNAEGGKVSVATDPYIRALSARTIADPHTVGVVVAVNGKALAADTFADSRLFRKMWPRLLASYAAEAARHPAPKVAPKAFTPAAASAFLTSAARGQHRTLDRNGSTVSTRLEGRQTLLYRSGPAGAHPSDRAPALHTNVLAK